MCPLGGRQKSWGTRHVHKVLSQTYQNLGQVRGRTQRWCLPASLVSEESLKSLVYLIRSLFSGHSYKYKQTYHFHRMSSNVFQSAASVLCCGVVCSQVRTVSPFLTVPQNSWTQDVLATRAGWSMVIPWVTATKTGTTRHKNQNTRHVYKLPSRRYVWFSVCLGENAKIASTFWGLRNGLQCAHRCVFNQKPVLR